MNKYGQKWDVYNFMGFNKLDNINNVANYKYIQLICLWKILW